MVDWNKHDDAARRAVRQEADDDRQREEALRDRTARVQEITRSHVERLLAAGVQVDAPAMSTSTMEDPNGRKRDLWHIGDFRYGVLGVCPHYVDHDGNWWVRVINTFDPVTGRWRQNLHVGAMAGAPPWSDFDELAQELAKHYFRKTGK